MMKKGFNQYLIQTFNYAHKYTCVGYALVESTNKIEALFGAKDFVLVLCDLFVVVFITVEFNLKMILPLMGTIIFEAECKGKRIYLLLADASKRNITFNNDLDQRTWLSAIDRGIKSLKKG